MHNYINDHHNGLLKEFADNKLSIKVKILPPRYQNLINKSSKDGTLSVIVELKSTSPNSNEDFLISAANSLADYKQTIEQLNFRPEEYIYIKTKKYVIKPQIATFEDSFESNPIKKLVVGFPITNEMLIQMESEIIQIIFINPFEGYGEQPFEFKTEDLLDFQNLVNLDTRP